MNDDDRTYDLEAPPREAMPSLGARFEHDGLIIDLNTGAPFQANFTCPAPIFALQLGPRRYELGLDTDRLRQIEVNAGSVQISPPDSTVRCRLEMDAQPFLAVQLSPALAETFDNTSVFQTPNYDVTHPDLLTLGGLLQRFVTSKDERDPLYAQSLVQAAVAVLAGSISGSTRDEPKRTPTLSQHDAARIRGFIESELDGALGLDSMAQQLSMSIDAFTRRFKGTFGLTPHRYVMRQRLERAREMLTRTDEPIAEIAYACGFSSQAHLTSAMKQQFGATPGRMRDGR